MDDSIKSFHAKCLLPWNTSNCPICYYIQYPGLMPNSGCMNCKATDSLWMCIICGHVGCGKGLQAHALEHYKATQHKYVMGLEGFKVWDYKTKKRLHNLDDVGKYLDDLQKFPQPTSKDHCECPICRNNHTLTLLNQPVCMKCNQNQVCELWICLFCSHVGCSSSLYRHAIQHYNRTQHPYSMNLVNFSIWDYKEQKYIHRHLDDKTVPSLEITKNLAKRMDRLELKWQEFTELKEANQITTEKRLVNMADEKKILERKLFTHDTKLNELFIQFAINRKNISPLKIFKPKRPEIKADPVKNKKVKPKRDVVIKPKASVLQNKSLRNPTVTSMSSNLTDFMPFFILGLIVMYFFRLCFKGIALYFHSLF